MGNFIFKRLFGEKEVRVLILGLDAAGKTTILYKLKLGEVVTTIPTIGFNVETISVKNVQITAWDVGVRDKMRALIRHYYQGTDGLIFVVDSNDKERFEEAVDEILDMACKEDELSNTPVLVLANKQDISNVLTPEEIENAIIAKGCLNDRRWKVFGVSGVTGDRLTDSLDWFTDVLTENMTKSWFGGVGNNSETNAEAKSEQAEKNDTVQFEDKSSYLEGIFKYIKMKLSAW